MRPLTSREKRTIRLGAAVLAIYLGLLYGREGIRLLEERRRVYDETRLLAERLETRVLEERNRARRAERLRALWGIDFAALSSKEAIGSARDAILRSALASEVLLGPSRESAGRAAEGELARILLEGQGTTGAAVRFLHSLRRLGFPLVVDSLELHAVSGKPGQVRLALSVLLLEPPGPRDEEHEDA